MNVWKFYIKNSAFIHFARAPFKFADRVAYAPKEPYEPVSRHTVHIPAQSLHLIPGQSLHPVPAES